MTQRTSDTPVKPVSSGLAKLLGRMVTDAAGKYPGGLAKLELVKGDPDFVPELFRYFDARAASRAPKPPILVPVTTFPLAGSARFNPAEHYKLKGTPDGVRITYLGDNFQRLLAAVEIDVPAVRACVHRLSKRSVDGPILDELGGLEAAQLFLAHLWQLLAAQPTGQQGKLLTNGWANILYIKGWAVAARWHADSGGWYLYANPVTYPRPWHGGSQVFSL